MFKFSLAHEDVINMFTSTQKKLMKRIMLLSYLVEQASWLKKSTFFLNTKITSSKMGEDIDRKEHRKNTQVRCISHKKMINFMLKYPEVVTNMDIIKVPIIPLDL